MKKIKIYLKKYWIFFVVFIFLVLLYLIIKLVMVNDFKIEFNNSSKIKLNSLYEENYDAKYLNKNITNDVVVEGFVDTTKVGNYEIVYVININGKKHIKKRIISVVDDVSPVLTLLGNIKINICPNGNYEEEGYTAIDNYDGDISNKVKISKNKKEIIYTIKDSSNNVTIKKRKFIVKDDTPPVLTLTKGNDVYTYLNEKYIEEGYTAIDNCDKDISKKVEITGNVNTNKLGNYELTYSIIDSAGLSTILKRTIHVIKKPSNYDKTIYLTFDDGPSETTGTILDILKEENIKATFFVIGKSSSYDHLIIRAHKEGHTIGLHSYTHRYEKIYTSEEAFFNDLNILENKIISLTGTSSKVIRFPGGSSNTTSKKYNIGIMSRLAAETMKRGYIYFDWNVGSTDTVKIGSEKIYQNVISKLKISNTLVVLMHDTSTNYQTVDALRKIIKYGKDMGYNFAGLTTSTPQIKHNIAN